jgi:hypothetical protein
MILIKKLIYILLFSTLFSSCATIINGKRQNVTIHTEPAGAVVSDGKSSWLTPATLQLERKNEHYLTIVKPGYSSQSIVIKKVPSGAVAGNIVMPLSVLWIGVDIANGANFKLVPDKVKLRLLPKGLYKKSSNQKGPFFIKKSISDENKNKSY